MTSIKSCHALSLLPLVQGSATAEPVVYVVDDDHAIRASLPSLLESVHLTVKAFASAHAFLEQFDPTQPGCLLLDVRMPGMSGLELQEKLLDEGRVIPIIFISCYVDWPMAVRAMRKGAFDFLEKPFNDQHLLDTTQEALRLSVHLRNRQILRDGAVARLAKISERERVVMDWMVTGKRSKEIAALLGLSTKTVETHRANIMVKMEVKSVAELVHLVWLSECTG
ncbi:MAG: response regulator transcription factor [Magnetococcales bacterium]|nr:response regulator transcription factor [Magnetococcales bacterium]